MSIFSSFNLRKDLFDDIAKLPHLPGVYRYFDIENNLLYVGKARDLKKRVSSYFQNTSTNFRVSIMVSRIVRLEITITSNETEALLLENNLIKTFYPRFNILFRDDKSYPYLKITKHIYPRITYYRGLIDSEDEYFGPFPNVFAVKDSIQILQKIFLLRTCKDTIFINRTRPCLLYQIRRCSAPCVNLIRKEDYMIDIENASKFLRGYRSEVMGELEKKMYHYANDLQFEKAATERNKLLSLSNVLHHQTMETNDNTNTDIIVVIVKDNYVCVNLATVRNGRHLGDRAYFPSNFNNVISDTEIFLENVVLKTFLIQHYINKFIPNNLIINIKFSDTVLMSTLMTHCGHDINLIFKPRGQHRQWLDSAYKNAEIALTYFLSQEKIKHMRIHAMVDILKIQVPEIESLRIECFDISHMQGEATKASCVVFHHYVMQYSEYRRYNINNVTPGDDYAAMRQVLMRHYKKIIDTKSIMPDLVFIDGGKGQVEVARKVFIELKLNISLIVGIAKGISNKIGFETLFFADNRLSQKLNKQSSAVMLIRHIRDEAHRFAITGMRAKLKYNRQKSQLDKIKGIGIKRRQKLLVRFGGLQGVINASVDDLISVNSISRNLAEEIYKWLH